MHEETIRAGAGAVKEVAALGNRLAGYFEGPILQFSGALEDTVSAWRLKRVIKLRDDVQNILQERGLEFPSRDVPPKFALPLLNYASLEEDDELQARWARLLANAADASIKMDLRTAYVEILKELTALDVKILDIVVKLSGSDLPPRMTYPIETEELPHNARVHVDGGSRELGFPSPSVMESLSNLNRLGCLIPASGFGGAPAFTVVYATPLGISLYRACSSDPGS
jgi:Abortive infection alpha